MKKLPTTLVAVVAGALLVVGCSPAVESADADKTSDKGSAQPATQSDPQARAAADALAAATEPVESFEPPGPALEGVEGLAGKKVYYVPAVYGIPLFKTLGDSLTAALETAGVTVEVCDGKANPSDVASCLSQAVDAKAAAVITGSIPVEMASTAFRSVQDAGIPLLNAMTVPAGEGDPRKTAYLTPNFVQMQAWSADAVIADSDGKAHVLAVQVTDNPATELWMKQGALAEYEKNCPDCEVTVIRTNTGQLDKLPSAISSALSRDPEIKYVQTQFDATVQPTVQGLQAAAGGNDVQISSMDGTLAVMQMLEDGRFVGSEVGYNLDALAWYSADQVLRMMTGQASIPNLQFPYQRVFTPENVGELQLTAQAQGSGEWYGATDYREGFTKLWGLS